MTKIDKTEDALLPCPFCGSRNIDPEGWQSKVRSGPACDDCSGTADSVKMWNTRQSDRPASGLSEWDAAIQAAMKALDDRRISEAGMFDKEHSGQRGEDRSNALFCAYHIVRGLTGRRAEG